MTATLRTDFDSFLFAPIGEDTNGLPLTLLSVFARLGIDPWEEAADLSQLPLEPALQRLTSRLEAAPNARPESAADTVNIATRLIALLHRPPPHRAPPHRAPPQNIAPPELLPQLKMFTQSKSVRMAIYCLLGLLFMLVVQRAMSDPPESAPMDTTNDTEMPR